MLRFLTMAPTPAAAPFETKPLQVPPGETAVRFRQRRLPLGFATALIPMLILLSSSSFFLVEGFASRTVGRNGRCQSCTNHLYRHRYPCSQQQQQQQSQGQKGPMDFGGAVVGGRKQTQTQMQTQTQTQRLATIGDLTTEDEQPKKRYGAELRRARREERLLVRRQRAERQEKGSSAAASSTSISSLPSRTVVGPLVRSLARIRSKLSSIWIAFRCWLSRS